MASRRTLYLMVLILLTVSLLAMVWEIFVEDLFLNYFDPQHEIESSEEHWEYVVTSVVFASLALVVPGIILHRILNKLVGKEKRASREPRRAGFAGAEEDRRPVGGQRPAKQRDRGPQAGASRAARERAPIPRRGRRRDHAHRSLQARHHADLRQHHLRGAAPNAAAGTHRPDVHRLPARRRKKRASRLSGLLHHRRAGQKPGGPRPPARRHDPLARLDPPRLFRRRWRGKGVPGRRPRHHRAQAGRGEAQGKRGAVSRPLRKCADFDPRG